MSTYDYEKAKGVVQKYSDLLESAYLGMAEDWFWTATEVYADRKFQVNLDEEPKIGGIKGSIWATPALLLKFKDGTEKFIDCYVGKIEPERKPGFFELGELSSECQGYIDLLRGL